MTQRLHVKSLLSIGAVEAGDNPEADILFWKRKPPVEPREGLTKEGDSMATIESLDDALARISELETRLAEFTVEPPSLPDDLPEVVAKRLDEQDIAIAKAEAMNAELTEKLAKAEDERATEKYTKMAEQFAAMLGDPAESMPVLKALGTADPENAEKLHDMLAAGFEKAAFAELLKEYGSASVGGSVADQIAAKTDEIRKENPALSNAEARAEAWRRNPDLLRESREGAVV